MLYVTDFLRLNVHGMLLLCEGATPKSVNDSSSILKYDAKERRNYRGHPSSEATTLSTEDERVSPILLRRV